MQREEIRIMFLFILGSMFGGVFGFALCAIVAVGSNKRDWGGKAMHERDISEMIHSSIDNGTLTVEYDDELWDMLDDFENGIF